MLMDESTLITLHPKHSRCLTSTVSVLKHSLLLLVSFANKQLTMSTWGAPVTNRSVNRDALQPRMSDSATMFAS